MKRPFVRFHSDRRGGVAVIMALAMIPVTFLVGAGVDYARGAGVRAKIQAATDAAALAVIREAPTLTTDAAFQARARAYFDAGFPAQHGVTVTRFVPARAGTQVTVTATAQVDMTLGRLMHPAPIEVSGTSQATSGGKAVEIALVLDNTGSMNESGKLPALKQAAKDFLTYLDKVVVSRSDAKVALVPFSTQVNLGTGTTSAGWLSFGKLGTVSSTSWKGCIADRDQPYDVQIPNAEPTGAGAYPADGCDSILNGKPTLSAIRPLGTDYAALSAAIDGMSAGGNTNVTIGVAWGMEALTPYGPLSATSLSNDRVTKIMIVLTDGLNTENRWNKACTGNFFSDYFSNPPCVDGSVIDARTLSACSAAKNAGIIIYTVRVIDGNTNVLRSCATKDGFFYNVITADDLKPAFQSIGSSIAQFRLTQ
ncbi:vWA domain-containing protein [Methylobacterium nonmethylotrophicum]|uniref:TadE/TadG family protein n=1 Tax=Methylobacterium nonmethylotrophicum TaxID=1141884 RepID=A0A4Z0NVT9_9HYPH|nr:pilus assembly protein [Methylobacterium nonmethylotrophicum]TGE01802.1 TadE/TadG family protein [Methylobacterium nonmethylotrophicum]